MNSVLPVSIIPCQSVLITTIFKNVLRARHFVVVMSFNFHSGTVNEKVSSYFLHVKKLRLGKFLLLEGSLLVHRVLFSSTVLDSLGCCLRL